MISLNKWFAGIGAACLLLSLGGCGGGTDHGANAGGAGRIGASDDSFIAQVRALISLEGETPDVLPFDSITVTTPEESEPVEI